MFSFESFQTLHALLQATNIFLTSSLDKYFKNRKQNRFSEVLNRLGPVCAGEIPSVYKWEMMNRAVHAAARAGNRKILKELLRGCSDASAYRDVNGSTVLHSAAAKGRIEVSFNLILTNMILMN